MEVFNKIKKIKRLAIALGYFDGVHLGHKKLLSEMILKAKKNNLETAIITFERNPVNYFNKEFIPNIFTSKDREEILEAIGIDYLFELNFHDYKNMSAQEYFENIIYKYLKPELIYAGYNHHFGCDRVSASSFFELYKDKYKFEFCVLSEQKLNDYQTISSSAIREKISAGNIDTANKILGRKFFVRNSVVKGDGRAKILGYPTANVIWPDMIVKLPYGVYGGFIYVKKKMLPALISWGNKPTFSKSNEPTLEVHIPNFNDNIYGKIVKVIFNHKIRDIQKFSNIVALRNQLDKDYSQFTEWTNSLKF